MEGKLRIVIFGAGLIGPRHALSVQSHPSSQLIAFIDPSPSALPIAADFNVPCHPSLESLLSVTNPPDAAIICTPNHTHVPLATHLLTHKIPILLEKPISDSLSSAESLLSLSSSPENNDTKILLGHHRRFNPYIQATKALLASNSLGSLIAVNGLWTLLKPDSYFAPPLGSWRADRQTGGVLGINLIHDIDVLHFLFGPIVRVHAEPTPAQRIDRSSSSEHGREHEHEQKHAHTAEEGCALTLRFASGMVGTFLICDATPSPLNFETGTRENPTIPGVGESSASDCYRVFGTRASLSVPDMTRWSYDGVAVGKEKGWNCELGVEKVDVPGVDVKPFDTQWAHFVRVLKGEEEVSCSIEDGVRALRVVRAVKEVLEEGGGGRNI
ncbi:quinate utilization oxidoreductase QutH [Aspergillus varians]